ncbi:MAG: ATPase [Thermoproteus sp.]
MYNVVDSPFSPSGVTHLFRLHRALGFEKELAQAVELFDLVSKTHNNVLAVVVAPYGYGKSEFLDEVQREADARGLKYVRVALSHSFKDELLKSIEDKPRGAPLVVLIDEADELSRLAAMYRLGALSNEQFRQAVIDLASLVRALLEPRNYSHVLKSPENYDKVLIIAALTPQVYYTILKNVVPDVFDITTGRVYREITLDTRFPFWLYLEVVESRLDAYMAAKRPEKFWPFTLHELAALYNIALRKGEANPRYLLKLTARLFELKNRGRGLVDLALEEGISLSNAELAEYVLSGIPLREIKEKYRDVFKMVYLYKIPFKDKEAINIINRFLGVKGKEIVPSDEKSASYEPYLYYSVVEGGSLFIYFVSDDEIEELGGYLLGRAYVISEDVANFTSRDEAARLSKELAVKLQEPATFLAEVERLLELGGIRMRTCCGRAVWYNNLGFRELVILSYIDREGDLNAFKENINRMIIEGLLDEYPIDYMIIYIFSSTLLSSELEQEISPLLKISWKNSYTDTSNKYVYINIYGADKLDKLKYKIIKFQIDKILGKEAGTLEIIEELRLARERARENVLRYTLALKRGKERKEYALLKAAEQIISGSAPEGMSSFNKIADILLRRMNGSEIHEKEIKSLITRLFPINLWRDIREEDLLALLVYTGYLVPSGDRTYVKFDPERSRKFLEELSSQLKSYVEVSVGLKSVLFGEIKLAKRLDVESIPLEFNDVKEYAMLVIRHKKAILDLQQKAEDVKRELEQELKAKRELISKLEKLAEKMPQRVKFMSLDEKVVEREAAILEKTREALELWESLRPMALELGKGLSVDLDLNVLLNLPEPWLEDYLASLKLYSVKLREEYEAYRRKMEIRRNIAEWVKTRLGSSGDVEGALKAKSSELKVPYQLLVAIASRGPGAELNIEALASEISMDVRSVAKYLETLAEKGLVAKKYVS